MNESGLRTAVYEAIMAFLQFHADDCYPQVQKVAWTIVERLRATLSTVVSVRQRAACLAV